MEYSVLFFALFHNDFSWGMISKGLLSVKGKILPLVVDRKVRAVHGLDQPAMDVTISTDSDMMAGIVAVRTVDN